MQAMTPITPLESGVEMFQRGKMQSLFPQRASGSTFSQRESRTSQPRPVSEATEIFDTDFEDDSSDFEEDSPKYSFESSDSRRSQTTLSSFDEVLTPLSTRRTGFEFKVQDMKPVEGPRGPHLFRASQTSVDFDFDFALQLSPIAIKSPMTLPPHQEPITEHEFITQTPATIIAPHQFSSLATAMQDVDSSEVRLWTAQQVAVWMSDLGFDGNVIEKFKEHDITGAVLLDMQFEDLKELDIPSFGKRHQLWNHIDALRDNDGRISPVPTPFQDVSRPCTRNTRSNSTRNRSKSRRRRDGSQENCDGDDDIMSPITPGGGKKKRSRKQRNLNDIITPGESVSIVAIEQLLPKPHKCAKGERCAKWRKQQRQLARLQEEHGFPISPEKGGQIFIAGDPGNAASAGRMVNNVMRPSSENVPSVVASSTALAADQMPALALQEEMLQCVELRDPQENVKQFLSLQGYETQMSMHQGPPTPPLEMFPPLQPPDLTPAPHSNLKNLPKLSIPRAASAQPAHDQRRGVAQPYELDPNTAFSPCRTALSPAEVYRFGTPASEMDVPVTAIPSGPVSRDASQSVPPNMVFRDPTQRTASRVVDWRRPSFALPSLQEGQVFSPAREYRRNRNDDSSSSHSSEGTLRDSSEITSSVGQPFEPKSAHDLKPPSNPITGSSGQQHYVGASHAGWMKKRKTKLLRHEWNDAHFRLNGTQLAQHPNALPSSSAINTIDIDDYAVACSSIASSKLAAKLKALKISSGTAQAPDGSAFSFQLVPSENGEGDGIIRRKLANGKTHHFAVTTRDERIDWMRELMLAKALRAKGQGYEVQVNGASM